MASNEIRKQVPDVRDASVAAERGLARNEALPDGDPQKIVVKRITAQLLHDQREDLLSKERTFNDRRNDKSTAVKARQKVNLDSGKALQNIRNGLKVPLGNEHSPAWTAAGWTHNSLEIPTDADAKVALLGTLIPYFGAHSAQQNPGLGGTVANCNTLKNRLGAALSAESATQTPLVLAKNARDAAINTLHKSLMTLLGELGYELPGDDARYYDFGFTPPALDDRPGVCAGFVAHPGHEAGIVALDWLDADHADRYQVQKQIVGTDADFALAATVHDSDATLEDLPTGATVRFRVRAVNAHGEGPWSAVLEVVVG